jgi:hypothetical protein
MSSRAQDVRKFLRAAEQRMKAAEFLFDHGFWLDSVYLGGYAVECALKALILERTADNVYAAMYDAITKGSIAHDFMFLRGSWFRRPSIARFPRRSAGHCGRCRRGAVDFATRPA